jgi:hypothetical protein
LCDTSEDKKKQQEIQIEVADLQIVSQEHREAIKDLATADADKWAITTQFTAEVAASLQMASQEHREAIKDLAADVHKLKAGMTEFSAEDFASLQMASQRHREAIENLADDADNVTARIADKVTARMTEFFAEAATSQGQLEAVTNPLHSGLLNLRQEMQKELTEVRLALQGHKKAIEALSTVVLKGIQPKSGTIALELSNRVQDIETKSDAIALDLKDRLDDLRFGVLKYTTRLDGLSPREEAAEFGINIKSDCEGDILQRLNTHIEILRTL